MQLSPLPTNCETYRFKRKMLTSKSASLSYSVTTWASLRSSALLLLHMATFLFLHYRTWTLKGLSLFPSLPQHTSLPCLSTA